MEGERGLGVVWRDPSEMSQRDRLSKKKRKASAKTLEKEQIWHVGKTIRKPTWLD